MKKINIIILFLILISIVNAINTDQLAQEGKNKAIGAICKFKQGGEACKAYEILKNPTTPLTNELGPGEMKFFSAIKDPMDAGKGDGFEEIQLDSGEEVIFIEQPKKKLIIKSGIVNFKVNNVDYKEIRDGEFRIDKDGKIEYAKFTAGIDLGGIYGPNTKHNEYKFNYLNKEYKFDV